MFCFCTCKTIQLYSSTQAVNVQRMVQMNMDRAKRDCAEMGSTPPITCDLLNIACVVGMEQKKNSRNCLFPVTKHQLSLIKLSLVIYTFVRN